MSWVPPRAEPDVASTVTPQDRRAAAARLLGAGIGAHGLDEARAAARDITQALGLHPEPEGTP